MVDSPAASGGESRRLADHPVSAGLLASPSSIGVDRGTGCGQCGRCRHGAQSGHRDGMRGGSCEHFALRPSPRPRRSEARQDRFSLVPPVDMAQPIDPLPRLAQLVKDASERAALLQILK